MGSVLAFISVIMSGRISSMITGQNRIRNRLLNITGTLNFQRTRVFQILVKTTGHVHATKTSIFNAIVLLDTMATFARPTSTIVSIRLAKTEGSVLI